MMEANARQKELEATKSHILVELRQLVYQCDQTMKAVGFKTNLLQSTLSVNEPTIGAPTRSDPFLLASIMLSLFVDEKRLHGKILLGTSGHFTTVLPV